MAKKPEPAPKRKLTDPEFDDYDCRSYPDSKPTPEQEAAQQARVAAMREAADKLSS